MTPQSAKGMLVRVTGIPSPTYTVMASRLHDSTFRYALRVKRDGVGWQSIELGVPENRIVAVEYEETVTAIAERMADMPGSDWNDEEAARLRLTKGGK